MVTPLEPDDPRALGEFTLSGRLGEGGQGWCSSAGRRAGNRSR